MKRGRSLSVIHTYIPDDIWQCIVEAVDRTDVETCLNIMSVDKRSFSLITETVRALLADFLTKSSYFVVRLNFHTGSCRWTYSYKHTCIENEPIKKLIIATGAWIVDVGGKQSYADCLKLQFYMAMCLFEPRYYTIEHYSNILSLLCLIHKYTDHLVIDDTRHEELRSMDIKRFDKKTRLKNMMYYDEIEKTAIPLYIAYNATTTTNDLIIDYTRCKFARLRDNVSGAFMKNCFVYPNRPRTEAAMAYLLNKNRHDDYNKALRIRCSVMSPLDLTFKKEWLHPDKTYHSEAIKRAVLFFRSTTSCDIKTHTID